MSKKIVLLKKSDTAAAGAASVKPMGLTKKEKLTINDLILKMPGININNSAASGQEPGGVEDLDNILTLDENESLYEFEMRRKLTWSILQLDKYNLGTPTAVVLARLLLNKANLDGHYSREIEDVIVEILLLLEKS